MALLDYILARTMRNGREHRNVETWLVVIGTLAESAALNLLEFESLTTRLPLADLSAPV